MEKKVDPIDTVTDLTLVQNQLSATLFNRLQAVTTGTANTMVVSAKGNGCEAWRLLNKWYDPRTDQRLTKVVIDIISYKIRGKDLQGGLNEWEQMINSLETDHMIKLDPQILKAFILNILPKWMSDKVFEHLDRLKTYSEVREKALALSQTHGGADCNQVGPTEEQWPEEHDEGSGCQWRWVDSQSTCVDREETDVNGVGWRLDMPQLWWPLALRSRMPVSS